MHHFRTTAQLLLLAAMPMNAEEKKTIDCVDLPGSVTAIRKHVEKLVDELQ